MFHLVVTMMAVAAATIACGNQNGPADVNPVGPSALMEEGTAPAATVVADTAGAAQTAALTLPTAPRPTLTRIDQPTAAPGVLITLYGTNFKGTTSNWPYLPPLPYSASVRFGSVSARAESTTSTQIKVRVPSYSGSVQVTVTNSGGSASLPFTYKAPRLSQITPSTGDVGQTIILRGSGFGVKDYATNSWVKVGASMVSSLSQWTDGSITIKAPTDYGTGLNDQFWISLGPCIVSSTPLRWLINLTPYNCKSLWNSALRDYQLSTSSPGYLTKTVLVTVRTAAGTSNSLNFTYKTPIRIQ